MDVNPFDIYTQEYEEWFKHNQSVFQSELLALRQVIPSKGKGLEIGVGSGIFAEPLGIKYGIDPSEEMLKLARQRNLVVEKGYAEDLPFPNKSFDFAVFITSLCFITEPQKALDEAHRVITDNGKLIVAFLDKDSWLGQILEKEKENSKFYKPARFYSVLNMISMIERSGFKEIELIQTLTKTSNEDVEKPTEGYGKGGFVVIKALK